MQKNAFTLTVSALVLSVFGAFLRWVQTMTIFEEETGLPLPSSPINTVYVVYCLAVLATAAGATNLLFRGLDISQDGEEMLYTDSPLLTGLSWLFCACLVGAGIQLMFSSGGFALPVLQRLFGAVCVAAGACVPALPCRREATGSGGGPARKLMGLFLCVFFCFWLIYCYRSNADNPTLWRYIPHIVAVCVNACTMYYIAAWYFGVTRPMRALILLPYAAFLNLCVALEGDSPGLKLLYLGTAGTFLLLYYIVTANLFRE